MARRPPPTRNPIPDDKREEVIRLYKEGVKIRLIIERTGVPKSSIYNIVKKAKLIPDRGVPAGGMEAYRERQLQDERLDAELAGYRANIRDKDRRIKDLEGQVATLREQLLREQANFDHLLRNGTKARPRPVKAAS